MTSPGIIIALVFAVLIITVSCQTIITPNQVMTGGKFSVVCDASRVPTVPSDANNILKLTIFRNTTTYTQIARYTTLTSGLIPSNSTTAPSGRNWNFTFSGANGGVNNRNTMRLQVDVNDAMCSDAGAYICFVQYYSEPREIEVNAVQNLTTVAGTSSFFLKPEPDHSTDDSPNYSEYTDTDDNGVNITFTCSVNGPENIKLDWQYSTYNEFSGYNTPQKYPYTNDITDAAPEPIPGSSGCAQYYLTSKLMIVAKTADNMNMYFCNVLDNNNQVVESDNFTIGIKSVTSGNSGQTSSAGPDDSNVGMIVGIVVGCVVLIIIIIVIIVVVRMRKKKSEEDTYKTDRVDGNTEANLHAPPPVFYSTSSKPSKNPKDEKDSKIHTGMTNEALDNSYDSRDSVSKGPPRYANTDPDNQGPPRYEKESHRGRQNRGYDDDDRNGGHGRSRPREHGERRHRSREQNDDPQPRYYNTDDGTDGRTMNFGDPDIGTSI